MRWRELKRLREVKNTLLKYGLDELVWELGEAPLDHRLADNSLRGAKLLRKSMFWRRNEYPELPSAERVKLALQELGPVYIKFGQMLSTRRDLLPLEFAEQLALLQDQVPPFSGEQAIEVIEQELKQPLDAIFSEFDPIPLASASIAQVHTAKLKDTGEEVVVKVLRPGIEKVIRDDVALMKRLAMGLAKAVPDSRRLRPLEVVEEYETTILAELDLALEGANATRLRENFTDSPLLYVPWVATEYSRRRVMVMERIYGIPVSDIEALKAQGTNLKLLAERGVEVFFTQVFRDSFFHADMHPGNVLVSYEHPEDPLWIGIDCGIIGTLNRQDKRYLAEVLLAFFNRDYYRVAELHVTSGWVPPETRVEEFETAIRTVCEPIFAKPLAEISFGQVLVKLFSTARRFNMQVQPQLVLLQKTLLYVEGLGRQLYPQLDLWQTAKPYLENWMAEQIGPQALLRSMQEHAPLWAEKVPELPGLMYQSLSRQNSMQDQLDRLMQRYQHSERKGRQARFMFGVGATGLLCATWLLGQSQIPLAIAASGAGVVSWVMAWWKIR